MNKLARIQARDPCQWCQVIELVMQLHRVQNWKTHHRIPRRQNHFLPILKHFHEFLWRKSLWHDNLEHESTIQNRVSPSRGQRETSSMMDLLLKPLVAHHEIPVLTRLLAPRIFYFVPYRPPAHRVDMHTGENHRMCHGRLIDLQPLCFRHT